MNRILRLLLALALPSVATATDVKGKVVDAQTGEPIARARVTGKLSVQRPATANFGSFEMREVTILTDAEGNFVFHNAEGGYLELTAERIGYVPVPGPPLVRLQVSRDQLPGSVSLPLTRQAVLKGRLAGDRGQPLSGQVTLLYERTEPAAKPLPLRTIYVDRTGEFRFSDLNSGRYFLKVTNAHSEGSRLEGKSYPPRYYPDLADLPSARAFNLGPGQEENVEFTIAALPAHQIRGRFASSERPGISLLAGNGESNTVAVTVEVDEKTQTFTISGVPPGVYLLAASWSKGLTAKPLPVTVEDADITGIVIAP